MNVNKLILFLFLLPYSIAYPVDKNPEKGIDFSRNALWKNEIKHGEGTVNWNPQTGSENLEYLSLQSENGAVVQVYKTLQLKANQVYRLSADIKTVDVAGNQGAVICLRNTWINSEKLIGTNDWVRKAIVFQTPENGQVEISFNLGFNGMTSTGTAYFNNPEIELLDYYTATSKYLTLRVNKETIADIRPSTIKEWLKNMDMVYEKYFELIGKKPYRGKKITILGVEQYPWGWAVAGNPILWHNRYIYSSLKDIEEKGDWSFGIMHEIAHDFNAGNDFAVNGKNTNWNWNEEMFANFRMYYAIEKLNGAFIQREKVYRGEEAKLFYQTDVGESYDKLFPEGKFSHDALMYTLIRIKDKIGWEPFKKTFHWLYDNKTELNDDWSKFNFFLDKLTEYSSFDVRSTYLDGELETVKQYLHKTVDVSEFGALADGNDVTEAVRRALEYCKSINAKKLIFPSGRYEFYPDKATEKYFFISNNDEGLKRIAFPLIDFSDFEIDGQGSTFIFHGYTCPFIVENSQNITIKNLSIDYIRTFHSEGTIVKIDDQGFDVVFDKKYPYRIEDGLLQFYGDGNNKYPYSNMLEFDPEKKETAFMAKDYWLWNSLHATQLPDSVVHIQKSGITATVGNVMVFGSAYRRVPGFTLTDSRNLTISGVNIYHCGGMGIIAQRCENIMVRKVNITPTPGSNRVVSITADATHFVNCSGKITLQDCLFENQKDDATNIHGIYAIISKIISPTTLELQLMHSQQLGFQLLKPGQAIELVDAPALVTVAKNKVKNVEYLNKEYMLVELEHPVPSEIKVRDAVGSAEEEVEVLISNCTIRSNRARGLLIGSRGKTIIENNYFHVPGAAILFEGDASYWFEQSGVKNCIIRNNTFDNCNFGVWGNSVVQVGSGIKKEERDRSRYNSNIIVENNVFKIFDPRLVNLYSVDNFIFRNNSIEASDKYPKQNETADPFVITSSSNINIDIKK